MDQSKIRLAGVIEESIVDGPGIRFTIFVQGCYHKCEGCHNEHTQDFDGGEDRSIDSIIAEIKENPLLDGVTFSGGEPFEQSEMLALMAKQLKSLNYHIIIYSGYTYEQIIEQSKERPSFLELLSYTDVLVDGKFEIKQRNLKLKFRGSENQRIIDVRETMKSGDIIITEL